MHVILKDNDTGDKILLIIKQNLNHNNNNNVFSFIKDDDDVVLMVLRIRVKSCWAFYDSKRHSAALNDLSGKQSKLDLPITS